MESLLYIVFFFNDTATTEIYTYGHTLSLHDALPIYLGGAAPPALHRAARLGADAGHGVFGHPVDAELGRHDQRADDAERRVGQDPYRPDHRSEEHTSELHSLMRSSYAVFCLLKKLHSLAPLSSPSATLHSLTT